MPLALLSHPSLPPLDLPLPALINADPEPDAAATIARTMAFAESASAPALVVTLLRAAPPGLGQFARHEAAATLWAFTRQAALDWAPRDIRVNAIGLGFSPFGPDEADDIAGRAAAAIRALLVLEADIVTTLRLMAGLPSFTGQIIRLGAPPDDQGAR